MARTAAGQRSFRHELFLYRSAVDLLEFVVPLARDGVVAEELTLLLLRAATAQAVLQQWDCIRWTTDWNAGNQLWRIGNEGYL